MVTSKHRVESEKKISMYGSEACESEYLEEYSDVIS